VVALLERYLTRPPACTYCRIFRRETPNCNQSVPRGTCRVLWSKGKVCACKEGEVHHRQVELTLAAGNAVPNSSLFGESRAVPTCMSYECKKGKPIKYLRSVVGYKLVPKISLETRDWTKHLPHMPRPEKASPDFVWHSHAEPQFSTFGSDDTFIQSLHAQ
jgi:hypothetical protein